MSEAQVPEPRAACAPGPVPEPAHAAHGGALTRGGIAFTAGRGPRGQSSLLWMAGRSFGVVTARNFIAFQCSNNTLRT